MPVSTLFSAFRFVFVFMSTLAALAVPAMAAESVVQGIDLPPGFVIRQYAAVPAARSLALSEKGTLFVGTRADDKVYAVTDTDGDHVAETVRVVAQGLRMPNGVALRGPDLYVAEVGRILRFPEVEAALEKPGPPDYEVVTDAYPEDRHHGWKYIAFGPDGLLYVPVGAPCNVCEEPDPYASITRLDVDNGEFEVVVRGVRNSVGFDWHPDTGELWFTNNGRDRLGDDLPPDSLQRVPEPGLHFGFPYCHAGVPDPRFGQGVDCGKFAPPALKLPAHVAPLGMAFYTGAMFPDQYRGQIFLAEHGSWNRSTPIGYRLILARFQADGSLSYEVFASGWLEGSKAWGRPVDVLVMPDGALLVSDDRAGAIYRITYEP